MLCFSERAGIPVNAWQVLLPWLFPKSELTSCANRVLTLTLFTGKPSVRISWVMRTNCKGERNAQGNQDIADGFLPGGGSLQDSFIWIFLASLSISLLLTPCLGGLWILNLNDGPLLPSTTISTDTHHVLLRGDTETKVWDTLLAGHSHF